MSSFGLFQIFRGAAEERADQTVRQFARTVARLREVAGITAEGLRVLEVGPGQQLLHMHCFSVSNEVIGIDTDVIPQGVSIREYVKMLRVNSGVRVVKTLGRKLLGFDADFERALGRRLGRPVGGRRLDVRQMDACRMDFADASFDLVHSHSVFEHILDPAAALREVRRVLRPGGAAYISVHLYSSHSGSHDPGIMARGRPEPPLWPHLREEHRARVRPSTYLNEVRLAEWRRIFDECLPGTVFVSETQEELAAPLADLRAAGDLAGWRDDELLTLNFIGIYRK